MILGPWRPLRFIGCRLRSSITIGYLLHVKVRAWSLLSGVVALSVDANFVVLDGNRQPRRLAGAAAR